MAPTSAGHRLTSSGGTWTCKGRKASSASYMFSLAFYRRIVFLSSRALPRAVNQHTKPITSSKTSVAGQVMTTIRPCVMTLSGLVALDKLRNKATNKS